MLADRSDGCATRTTRLTSLQTRTIRISSRSLARNDDVLDEPLVASTDTIASAIAEACERGRATDDLVILEQFSSTDARGRCIERARIGGLLESLRITGEVRRRVIDKLHT